MKFVVVDIETAGIGDSIDYDTDVITEIGIVLVDTESSNVSIIYHSYVKEPGFSSEIHKNSWGFRNSDISITDIESAKDIDMKVIQEIFNKYPATSYNTNFDFTHLSRRGFRIKDMPCLMKSFSPNRWMKFQMAWNVLMRTPYVEKHRASDDAYHEGLFALEMIRRGMYP